MRRRSVKRRSRIIYICLYTIMLCVCLMGVTYASWSNDMKLHGSFTTGSFSTVFQENGCSIAITDSKDNVIRDINDNDSECILAISESNALSEEDGTVIKLKTDGSLAYSYLNADDRFLRIMIPLKSGRDSTVNRLELTKADFDKPDEKKLEMKANADSVYFVYGDNKYKIPSEQTVNAAFPVLNFNVYRAVKEKNETVYAVIYLELAAESRNAFSDKVDFTFAEGDACQNLKDAIGFNDSSMSAEGTISIGYSCSIPVILEQGNSDTVKIEADSKYNGGLKSETK